MQKYKTKFEIKEKDLRKHLSYILSKLIRWAEQVERYGLDEVRKSPGWHDEPLKGKWKGFRSIRLNRSYRGIYTVENGFEVIVLEVSKHEY